MPSGQDVRFIRRHGRIIPIRLNREKAPRRRGIGLIAAGAGVAGGSAALSAGLFAANKMSAIGANKVLKTGLKNYTYVKRTLGLSKAVLRGGVGLGTGLFAAGMLRTLSQKDRPGTEGTVGAIAGIGAWTLSNKVFRTIVKRKIGV
jgi:hypothetical protein